METNDGGHAQFAPHMSTDPETHTTSKSNKQLPSREGGVPVPPATSFQPEAPDNLLEALRGASIVEEHRILMGTVIEKVQSVKSGLTEACSGLLTGFEVSGVLTEKIPTQTVAPETLSGVRKEKPDKGSIKFHRKLTKLCLM